MHSNLRDEDNRIVAHSLPHTKKTYRQALTEARGPYRYVSFFIIENDVRERPRFLQPSPRKLPEGRVFSSGKIVPIHVIVIVGGNGDTGKGAVWGSSVPMDDAGRAVNDASGFENSLFSPAFLGPPARQDSFDIIRKQTDSQLL